MKRGYAGDIVPLLPAMLAGAAVDQGEGSAQPAEPHHTPIDPIPSTSQPPHLSPQPQSPPHLSPPRSYKAPLPKGNTSGSAEDSMQLKELIVLVPTLVTRINSLEKELKDTKQTLGNAVLKLVKKVKSLETALKRKSKKVLISESEGEESEDQGRKIQDIDDDPLVSLGVSKEKSTNKGKRYRRKAREEINTGREEINTGIEEVSTGGTKRGQREGKALMIEEDIQATHKTKEQMRQEEAGLEEAIKLQAQLDEEVAKQIHLDKMIAKRMAEEEALTEQQKKRKAQVQFEAQFYTEEDWDTIRAKLEANAELSKDVLNEELKTEFEKLMKSIESFVPMETEARMKRHRLQLEQETSKKQKIDIEDASIIKGKDEVVKEEEAEVPVKKTGMRRKQKARKGISIDKNAQGDSESDKEESVEAMNPTPLAIKSNIVVN
ncbi:hypothetical protein Tco_0145717 [Tanacetum coccineum]